MPAAGCANKKLALSRAGGAMVLLDDILVKFGASHLEVFQFGG